MTVRRRPHLGIVLACVATLALGGCGGEPLPVDDGSVVALDGSALPDDTEVVSLAAPTSASAAEVVAALDEQDVRAEAHGRTDATGLSIDPAAVAGLVGTVSPAAKGRSKPFVVLVFDEPASALVFAAADDVVLDFPGASTPDSAVDSFFSGNLVGYYAPEQTSVGRDSFLGALTSLADS